MRKSTSPRLLIALCGVAASLSSARADIWDNSSGNGQWSTATNWADNTVPTINDPVTFPSTIPSQGATVTLPTNAFAQSLTFLNNYDLQGGVLQLSLPRSITVSGGRHANIRSALAGTGPLTFNGGGEIHLDPVSSNSYTGGTIVEGTNTTLLVENNLALGFTTAPITINGINARLRFGGANQTFLVNRAISTGPQGGTIELANGVLLDVNEALGASGNPLTFTGVGTVELFNASARSGSTSVSGVTMRLQGANALGSGAVQLSSGATLELSNGITYTNNSLGLGSNCRLRSGSGANTCNATCGLTSFNPVFFLDGGVNSGDSLTLGSSGASVWNGTGSTTITSGTVRLNSANNYTGSWTITGSVLEVNHGGALGTGTTPIVVNNAGRLRLNTPTLVRDITLNNPGGGLELRQDATVTGHIAIAPIAAFVPIIGPGFEFTLTGANSSLTSTGIAFFGGTSGVGSMRVTAGADVTGGSTRIDGTAAGPGRLTVSGAGSTWVNTGEIWIGNNAPGVLTVESGGAVSCPGIFIGVTQPGTATVTGEGSALTSGTVLKIGLATQSTMAVLAGADVMALDTFVGEGINASGTLTISGTGSTWTNQGLLIVGKSEPSGGTPAVGAINLSNSGTLSCQGLQLGDGATASSTLTVQGGLTRFDCGSSGVLMSQNGASSTLNLPGGLVDINGNITDAGAGVSTLILDAATLDMHNFAIGAGPSPIDNLQFRSGTLKNVAEINSGAGLSKTGPGTLFLNTSNTYTGPTNINQGRLFVVNSAGSATGPGLVTVFAGATLAGPGIVGGLVQNNGVVAPEGFNGNPVGTLTVNGTYSQFATGSLRIDIESSASSDLLVVTGGGASVAAGSLDVQLVNGFSPAQGDSFTILTASFISGQFPTTNLPALAGGLAWRVEYLSNAVRLVVVSDACPADVNADGELNPDDLADYIGAYFSGSAGGASDFNNDGETNPDDLADYIGAYFNGCG